MRNYQTARSCGKLTLSAMSARQLLLTVCLLLYSWLHFAVGHAVLTEHCQHAAECGEGRRACGWHRPWNNKFLHCCEWREGSIPSLLSQTDDKPRLTIPCHAVSLLDKELSSFGKLHLKPRTWIIRFEGGFTFQVTTGNEIQVIEQGKDSFTLPSVVAYLEDGTTVVGTQAKR